MVKSSAGSTMLLFLWDGYVTSAHARNTAPSWSHKGEVVSCLHQKNQTCISSFWPARLAFSFHGSCSKSRSRSLTTDLLLIFISLSQKKTILLSAPAPSLRVKHSTQTSDGTVSTPSKTMLRARLILHKRMVIRL